MMLAIKPKNFLTAIRQATYSALDGIGELIGAQVLIRRTRGPRYKLDEVFTSHAIAEFRFNTFMPQITDRAISGCTKQVKVERRVDLPRVTMVPDVEEQVLDYFFGCFARVEIAGEECTEVILVGAKHCLERGSVAGPYERNPFSVAGGD